ncbi:MAG: Cobalamin biosynthesis protein CobD [Desulfovibrio sp.]
MLFDNAFIFCGVTVAAFLTDRLIGDPPAWPHPVRWIGAVLAFLEPRARKIVANPCIAGTAAAITALAAVCIVTKTALLLPGGLALLAAMYLLFSGLAFGQLLREGKNALAVLESGDTAAARDAISRLVSRDVSNANEAALARALAETLAENINDAFVAPFFWYVLTGPVGLWFYKTASTMDSMWGYRHEPWTRFGTFAARLDDVLAYVPARLTVLCMWAAATLAPSGMLWPGQWPGWTALKTDAAKMDSPNAGWPMAAAAWLCGANMGGPTVYAGKSVEKPILGPCEQPANHPAPWTAENLRALLGLVEKTGTIAFAALLVIGIALRFI